MKKHITLYECIYTYLFFGIKIKLDIRGKFVGYYAIILLKIIIIKYVFLPSRFLGRFQVDLYSTVL